MLIEYLIVLVPLNLNGFLFELFDFFIILLYSGIFTVPLLLLLSVIFMAIIKKKYKNVNMGKILNVVTFIIPVILVILMLSTDFNARLQ